jgi:potassium efflux system protein
MLATVLLLGGSIVPVPSAAAASAGGVEAIGFARAALDAASLPSVQQDLARTLLDSADANERQADRFDRQLAELRAETRALPTRIEQLREALTLDPDQALSEWAERLPADAEGETLELIMEQERSLIAGLGAQLNTAAGELAVTLSRPAQTAGSIANLRRQLEPLLATPAVALEDEPALLTDVRRLLRASEVRRLQSELDLRLLEQETATQRQRVQELTLRELRFRQDLHAQRIDLLQQRIADVGRRQLDHLMTRLAERERELEGSTGVVATVLADNMALGNELLRQHELLADHRNTLAGSEQARAQTATSLRDSRTRLELGGTTQEVGRWLWSERRRIGSQPRLAQDLEATRSALAETRLALVTLNEQNRAYRDVRATARRLGSGPAGTDDDASATTPVEQLEPLLLERVELLALLEPLLERRIAALEQTETTQRAHLDDARTLQQLLDRHLLWVRSHRPVDAAWLQRVPESLQDLVKPSRYLTTLQLSGQSIQQRPLIWIGSLLLLLVLVELRRRAPAHIEAQASVTRQIRRDTFRATARALGWTVLAALPVPALLLLLGLLLQNVGAAGRFSHSLGQALGMLVGPALAVQFLRWVAVERGLGHAHFRWLRARRENLRTLVTQTALLVLPLYFLAALAIIRNLELANDVEARLAIVIACLGMAWTLWRALEAGRLWVIRGVDPEPSTLRRGLRASVPLVPLAIAGLALSGFVYSAGLLLQTMIATFSMIVAITVAVGLLARWFLLGERRLAWQRAEERRAAASGETTVQAPDAEPDLTPEQVNAQTGRLLRAGRLTLIAGGLIWVWSELLQAMTRLDDVALWHFSETIADGTIVRQPVTVLAVLLGGFILMLTAVGSRNLPGLIEIILLSRTRIDAASRYAITSILRYAIVIVGTLIGLSMFGMRWSQLQWMAAALTVGLGFGLQEIFANFVSGLILLFERPFRVGDVITVGELTGRVTRIRTRATTILDFDNKEIVVPNKSFITGQLINWTLSDTTTRVTIKVGVAYGSNPHLVRQLLLQAAQEQPQVLREPEPLSWFLSFGASSLDFELRVYVGTLGDRLQVQTAINSRITELFAEHGVEIAFPQLDLHVRDLPAPLLQPRNPPPTAG